MFDTIIQNILSVFGDHPYILIFVGLFFAGETVLLPAVYFALRGDLKLSYVILLALLATAVSDFVWYVVGSHMKNRFAQKVVSDRLKRNLDKLDAVFDKRGMLVLFLSKFVYGTRTAVQVLAGLHQMQIRKYVFINLLGISVLLGFIALLAYSIDTTLDNFVHIKHTLEIAFLVFVAILALTHIVIGVIWKKWLQR